MLRRPTRPTRTDTLFPDTTHFRTGQLDFGEASASNAMLDPRGGEPLLRHFWSSQRKDHILWEATFRQGEWPPRSEEHTSELQSLMRISYAVFCLKKKKYHQTATIASSITNINTITL